MKTTTLLFVLVAGAALSLAVGCNQQEPPPPAAPPSPKQTTEKAASQAQQSTEAVKAAPVPTEVKAVPAAPVLPQADTAQAAEALKKKAAEEKTALEKAAADKLAEGVQAAMVAGGNVPGLLESAIKLAGENQYAEALKVLSALANMKLTAEQQKLADALKDQITKAMAPKTAADAEKAMGGLLKK